jgi:hypothetical protein
VCAIFWAHFDNKTKIQFKSYKEFLQKKCTKIARISMVIFLKSHYLEEGFYRFDKTWLLFYLTYRDIEKAFKKSETALNYINHKRTNLLRLFIRQ